MLIAAFIAATLASSVATQAPHSPALARRADSLAALDPARELAKALRRGDRRYLGVCGYACKPPGLTLRELSELLANGMGGTRAVG